MVRKKLIISSLRESFTIYRYQLPVQTPVALLSTIDASEPIIVGPHKIHKEYTP